MRLHYASCVFEGERCYDGRIFKSTEHSQRLIDSGRILGFEVPYSAAELDAAKAAIVAKMGFKDCYVRPIAWRGSEQMGVSAQHSQDQRRDRGLGMGRLLQRPAAHPRHLRAAGAQHRPGARQGRRALHDLHHLQARRRGQGLRRRADAGLSRLRRRDDRRQSVLRHRRRDPYPHARLLPQRHHPAHGDRPRPEARLQRDRAAHPPGGADRGTGDLRDRHRRRGDAGARDRRSDLPARADHPPADRRLSRCSRAATPRRPEAQA